MISQTVKPFNILCLSELCDMVESCLIAEVQAHPKPGLVTPHSNGSHTDMDCAMFCHSAIAISDVFRKELPVVLNHVIEGRNEAALESLRQTGRLAEFAMFQVTSGINTHKGVIFLLLVVIHGVFHGAKSHQEALKKASKLCSPLTTVSNSVVTTGARAYRIGLRGVRGVVQDGFPSIVRFQKRFICEIERLGQELAVVNNLLCHMTLAEDTTLLNRCFDLSSIEYVQSKAQSVLDAGGIHTCKGFKLVNELDKDLVDRNLSPGGSADLTAVSLFLAYYYG